MDAMHRDSPAAGEFPASPDGRPGNLGIGVSGLYLALYIHCGFFAFLPLWLKTTGASPERSACRWRFR